MGKTTDLSLFTKRAKIVRRNVSKCQVFFVTNELKEKKKKKNYRQNLLKSLPISDFSLLVLQPANPCARKDYSLVRSMPTNTYKIFMYNFISDVLHSSHRALSDDLSSIRNLFFLRGTERKSKGYNFLRTD